MCAPARVLPRRRLVARAPASAVHRKVPPLAAVSTAGLQSLMRNCKETLLTYCQAQTPRIPWSRLLEQRKTHNKMLREQGITGRL